MSESSPKLVRHCLVELHDAATTRLVARLEGLTDAEYLWEAATGCWSVRRGPDGVFLADLSRPHPEPPPLTTIAWLTWHLHLEIPPVASTPTQSVERYFAVDPMSRREWPASADEAVTVLTGALRGNRDNLVTFTDADLEMPLGATARGFREVRYGAFLLHVVDELIHHGAEIGRMRDIYRATIRS